MPFTELGEGDWDPEDIEGSINRIYEWVLGNADKMSKWYAFKKRPVGRMASILRICAVLSIAIGAVGPLIAGVWSISVQPFSSPLSATFFATLAATFIGIDRAVGYTNTYIRYTQSFVKVNELRDVFRLNWLLKMAELGRMPTAKEDLLPLFHMLIAFNKSISNVAHVETTESFAEFEKGLAELQAQTEKLKAEAKKAI